MASFYFLIYICIANLVCADYWKFTLNNYHCIEPREWDQDHVYFRMKIVTRGLHGNLKRNETVDRDGSSLVPTGARSDNNVMWKDLVLNDDDAQLLFVMTA